MKFNKRWSRTMPKNSIASSNFRIRCPGKPPYEWARTLQIASEGSVAHTLALLGGDAGAPNSISFRRAGWYDLTTIFPNRLATAWRRLLVLDERQPALPQRISSGFGPRLAGDCAASLIRGDGRLGECSCPSFVGWGDGPDRQFHQSFRDDCP